MKQKTTPGQIIILNGAPRSGKSSLAAEIQATFDGLWMNLGVDQAMRCTPERYLPGIGLRPGGERPDLEPVIPILFRALYGETMNCALSTEIEKLTLQTGDQPVVVGV